MLTTVSVRSHFADPWNISKLRYLIAHRPHTFARWTLLHCFIASCIASTTDLFFLWTKIREQNKLNFIFTIEIASNCSEKNDDGKRRRNIYESRSLNSASSLSLMSCAETRSASLCSIGVKENLKNSLCGTWRRQPPTQCFSLSRPLLRRFSCVALVCDLGKGRMCVVFCSFSTNSMMSHWIVLALGLIHRLTAWTLLSSPFTSSLSLAVERRHQIKECVIPVRSLCCVVLISLLPSLDGLALM